MRVEVVKKFKDKHTNSILEVGQILEITHERFEEINSTDHGFFVEEITQEIQEEKGIIPEEPPKEEAKEEKKKTTKK